MTTQAALGQSQALNAREAGSEAARQALNALGRVPPVFGIVLVTSDFPIQEVLVSISTLVGNIPLYGFSTLATLTNDGEHNRSVIVTLVGGSDLQASGGWWAGYGQDSLQAIRAMLRDLQPHASGLLLLAADGLLGDPDSLSQALAAYPDLMIAGCLAGGDLRQGRTYQIGGQQAGPGGLAGLFATGGLFASFGYAHGWEKIGPYYKVTRSGGSWLRTLDERPAAAIYAELFGFPVREWSFPPLSDLVRIYPLEVEDIAGGPVLRSALLVEADGSLRLNAPVPEGSLAHVCTGSTTGCLKAAQAAAQQALDALQVQAPQAQPFLALAFVDAAWQALFEGRPGQITQALTGVLGDEIPLAGAYTFGQLGQAWEPPGMQVLNQHILVLLLAE